MAEPTVSQEVYRARMVAMMGMHPEEFDRVYVIVACGCDWHECTGWQLHYRKKKEADGE